MIPAKQVLWNPGATPVATSTYNIAQTDKNLDVDTNAARTLNLPTPSLAWAGNLNDVTGLAWQNNITLSRNGGSYTINGTAADLVLNSPRGAWYAYSDGTNYFVVGPT